MDEGFSFCLTPDDNGRECDRWNTLCTAKLKEVIALARKAFRWQSMKEGELVKDKPFKEWIDSRPLALTSLLGIQQGCLHPLQNGV